MIQSLELFLSWFCFLDIFITNQVRSIEKDNSKYLYDIFINVLYWIYLSWNVLCRTGLQRPVYRILLNERRLSFQEKKWAVTTYPFNLPISGHICKFYFIISLGSLVTMVWGDDYMPMNTPTKLLWGCEVADLDCPWLLSQGFLKGCK